MFSLINSTTAHETDAIASSNNQSMYWDSVVYGDLEILLIIMIRL